MDEFYIPSEFFKQLDLVINSIDKRGRNPTFVVSKRKVSFVYDDLNGTISLTSSFNFPDLKPKSEYSIDIKRLMKLSGYLESKYVHFQSGGLGSDVKIKFGSSTLDYGRTTKPIDSGVYYSGERYSYTMSQSKLNETLGMSLLLEGKKGRNMQAWVYDGVFHMGCKLAYDTLISKFSTPLSKSTDECLLLINLNVYTLLKFLNPIPSHIPITLRFLNGKFYGDFLALEALFPNFKLTLHIGSRGNPHETKWLKKDYPRLKEIKNQPLYYE